MVDWKWSRHPSQELLIRTIDELACGMLVVDIEGMIIYANQRVLEWSGYDVSEIEGQPVAMLVPPEFHASLGEERRLALEGDRRTRLGALQRKDRRTFPVAVSPTLIKRTDKGEMAVNWLLFDLGEVQTARPIGMRDGGLAAELSGIARRLQSISFAVAVTSDAAIAVAEHPSLLDLSPREKETLERLVSGLRVPTIAKELYISPHTVRNHLKSIYRKLNVSSQSELIELVRSLGNQDS